MASGYNARSPSVKRIFREIKEMNELMAEQGDGMAQFAAEALESDIFEWHFAVRGPDGTDFESGIYHGRILLPHDYPFKPPSFVMLTPSGRFETQTKICLSISSYHPEHWQPSWSMRTALTALIAFFPAPADAAIGSLTTSSEERRRLAAESRTNIPKVNNAERAEVVQRLHSLLLKTKVGAAAAPNPVPKCNAALGAPQFASNSTASPEQGGQAVAVSAAGQAPAGADTDGAASTPSTSRDGARSSAAAAAASAAEGRLRSSSNGAGASSANEQTEAEGAQKGPAQQPDTVSGVESIPETARSVAADADGSAAESSPVPPQAQATATAPTVMSWSERLEAWLPQTDAQLHKWRALRDLLRVLETALLVLAGLHLVFPVF